MSPSVPPKPSADDVMRDFVAPLLAVPEFEPAFHEPPPLSEARAAMVTTAGLMRHGETPWGHDDADFRVFGSDERDVIAGHVSISLDRVGMVLDRNVYYPIDRLNELADRGRIGSIAPRHISFMGALRGPNELSTVIRDSGPRAAKLLREDGVDVVVITPICPACSRTVLVLGHVFEAQGISTVVMASNLKIAQKSKAPRALFCDFPLGWPIGRPKDPEHQHRVLAAAFGLLGARQGPVLEIYPEAIRSEADAPFACTLPPRFDPHAPPPVDEVPAASPSSGSPRASRGATSSRRRSGWCSRPPTSSTTTKRRPRP
jgi:D-proline reductase (dithiol) PrdB